MLQPLVIDLFCGLGGWTKGFMAEGYRAIGFDLVAFPSYPGQQVLQDVTTLHGSQFRDAACIVASPPCQKYSYMAMPWSRAKREIQWQEWLRSSPFSPGFTLNDCFNACFRIQREASEAAGRYIPWLVENVKGAQRWVGPAQANFGSFYLWGDVARIGNRIVRRDLTFGNVGMIAPSRAAQKTTGHVNIRDGYDHTRYLTNQRESDGVKHPGMNWSDRSNPDRMFNDPRATQANTGSGHSRNPVNGTKQEGLSGPAWYDDGAAKFSSRSEARKAASQAIAEIPFDLARFVAQCFKPTLPGTPMVETLKAPRENNATVDALT